MFAWPNEEACRLEHVGVATRYWMGRGSGRGPRITGPVKMVLQGNHLADMARGGERILY